MKRCAWGSSGRGRYRVSTQPRTATSAMRSSRVPRSIRRAAHSSPKSTDANFSSDGGVCRHSLVDFVDVCTFPDFRLEPVEACAIAKKHVQVQKPMAVQPGIARRMVEIARAAGIVLGVVSQHRFDDSSQFLKRAIDAGRLGEILEADAYVKWYRSAEYYSRPVKGSWAAEGGGALINQAIHQADLLLWLIGGVDRVVGEWRLGALHSIESEDIVNALIRYDSGATGVIQASTAFRPGYPERIEIHGTRGSALVTGDKLTAWDVEDDSGERPPLEACAGFRRVRSDGDFDDRVRAAIPRFRQRHPRRASAAGFGRGRLSRAGAGGCNLPVVQGRARDRTSWLSRSARCAYRLRAPTSGRDSMRWEWRSACISNVVSGGRRSSRSARRAAMPRSFPPAKTISSGRPRSPSAPAGRSNLRSRTRFPSAKGWARARRR